MLQYMYSVIQPQWAGGSGFNMELASLETLKVNGVDSLGLGQVASIERVALL